MAFATPQAGDRFNVTVYFVSDKESNQQATRSFELPFDTNMDTTIGNAVSVANALADISKCKVADLSITVKLHDAVATAAVAGSSIFQNGIITCSLDVSGASKDSEGTIQIPDPVDAVRVSATGPNSYVLDVTDALITTLTGLYDGSTASISDGQAVIAPLSGRIYPKKGKVVLA
jgi:hypothetical protein